LVAGPWLKLLVLKTRQVDRLRVYRAVGIELNKEKHGKLFYCTRDECQGYGGWEPFADDLSRVRVVHPTGPGLKASVPQHDGSFPAKRIVGWTRFLDLPKPSEHDELGLQYT
jgi:hypothetical protein